MEHEHTQHVAAPPDQVFAALADIENLPRYVPQVTSARRTGRARCPWRPATRATPSTARRWFRTDEAAHRIEWGSPESEYHGWPR